MHPIVAYMILPLFAFANMGISLQGLPLNALLNPIPLGIASGLFFGKQIGVFGFSWLAIRLRQAKHSEQSNWLGLFGVAALYGIGFAMNLFISSLVFENMGEGLSINDRLGILVGSLLAGVSGYLILRAAFLKKAG